MPRILLSFLAAIFVLAMPAPAIAAETINWLDTPPESGIVVGSEVEIAGPGTFRLITLDTPEVADDHYEVSGTVRYSGVVGEAYLEMWSIFADGGAFFSRTLATEGPAALITGDNPGRDFVVPFSLNGSVGPTRIEVNVVMPGEGTVWVGPLTFEGAADASAWWSQQTSNMLGGTLGVAAGLSGALIGMLSGRRRAKRVVIGLLIAGLVVGAICILAGGAAILSSQPRHVWYPLALIGLILVVVDGALLPTTRRAYAAAELRRMRALDAT